MTGDDVLALQKLLNANGFTLAASGAGSPGNETTYFGALTRAALAKFQAANGISPAAGYYGPITRAYIAAHP
jgi:peptidoglycan hydrolase-like protein with peptidoglycan-binding domain